MKKSLVLFILLPFSLFLQAQKADSLLLSRIFETALTRGEAYEELRLLCKVAGHRLSGSEGARKAVDITQARMLSHGFDSVFRQEVMVPHWERGVEKGAFLQSKNTRDTLAMCALGGSVGGKVEGKVIEVLRYEDLRKLNPRDVQGKIVFFNRPMDPRMVYTFGAYGTCVDQRVFGAIWAGAMGAKGVVVRSMSLSIDDFPHTGSMAYADSVSPIPAIAISTLAAELLSSTLEKDPDLTLSFELNCRKYPDALSHNVVGELKGKEFPRRYIAVGGHLDSWDLGEGAHDDGAGCAQAIEALRILKTIGYQPRHTLRAVMWMNEENGLQGAVKYAEYAARDGEKHVAALESDRGAFAPRGYFLQADPEQIAAMQRWLPLLEPYGIHVIKAGGAGADVSPLKNKDESTILVGFIPDSQRYFDFHHASSDVFENVNKRELELGAAALAAMIVLLDQEFD